MSKAMADLVVRRYRSSREVALKLVAYMAEWDNMRYGGDGSLLYDDDEPVEIVEFVLSDERAC